MNAVRKRSVTIRGHRTSFSVEQPFFDELEAIAFSRSVSLAALVAEVDENRDRDANLSSALRVFVLNNAKAQAAIALRG